MTPPTHTWRCLDGAACAVGGCTGGDAPAATLPPPRLARPPPTDRGGAAATPRLPARPAHHPRFRFGARRERIDWGALCGIDVDDVVRKRTKF